MLTRQPKALDLCCGAGGASRGLQMAGFHVTGVDIAPQPRYAGDMFIQADALAYFSAHQHEYDFVWGSPPCQAASWSARRWINTGERQWADLIPAMRAAFIASGLPYVIENVIGAELSHSIELCGTMFGLPLLKHRRFESNVMLFQPPHTQHTGSVPNRDYYTVAGHGGNGGARKADWQRAMGIDWMDKHEMAEAIPPAYAAYVGKQIMAVLQECAA